MLTNFVSGKTSPAHTGHGAASVIPRLQEQSERPLAEAEDAPAQVPNDRTATGDSTDTPAQAES